MSQQSMSQARILLKHFKADFLHGLAIRSERVLEALERANCPVLDTSIPPSLEFRLSALFDALCISCQAHGVAVTVSDWSATFSHFCQLLMAPWPDAAITSAGYTIKQSHRGNSYATMRYKLLPTDQSSYQTAFGGK